MILSKKIDLSRMLIAEKRNQLYAGTTKIPDQLEIKEEEEEEALEFSVVLDFVIVIELEVQHVFHHINELVY